MFVKIVPKLWILSLIGTALCSNVLITDNSMSTMIELTTHQPYCQVHTDRGYIRNMLLAADASKVRQMSMEAIDKLSNVCANKKELEQQQGGFIYPGTKWCGPGNRAINDSDFGHHIKEDMCCRDHDKCPKFLSKGQCRNGICNNSPYTRSHCDCDAVFRKCLQNVNSEAANTIGAIFFNIIQVVCFKERNPCSEWQNDFSLNSELEKTMESLLGANSTNCTLQFTKSDRYVPSSTSSTAPSLPFNLIRKKKQFISHLLSNKFRYLYRQ